MLMMSPFAQLVLITVPSVLEETLVIVQFVLKVMVELLAVNTFQLLNQPKLLMSQLDQLQLSLVETHALLVKLVTITVSLVMRTETPHHTVIVTMDSTQPPKTTVNLVDSDVLNAQTQKITAQNAMETEHQSQTAYAHPDIMKSMDNLTVPPAHHSALNVTMTNTALSVLMDITLMEMNVSPFVPELNMDNLKITLVIHALNTVTAVLDPQRTNVPLVLPTTIYTTLNVFQPAPMVITVMMTQDNVFLATMLV